jgi:hypothetical protein
MNCVTAYTISSCVSKYTDQYRTTSTCAVIYTQKYHKISSSVNLYTAKCCKIRSCVVSHNTSCVTVYTEEYHNISSCVVAYTDSSCAKDKLLWHPDPLAGGSQRGKLHQFKYVKQIQDRIMMKALVNKQMDPRVLQKIGNASANWTVISFPKDSDQSSQLIVNYNVLFVSEITNIAS